VFVDEALSLDPVNLKAIRPPAREWAAMRMARTDANDPRYHGAGGPQAPRELSVSAIETYLTCPFKFFAQRVLKLDEERDDEEVMDPRAQGQFVHKVFEAFFRRWQDSGHRTITPADLVAARLLFAEVVEERIAADNLPEAEAAIERTRLLGSPVAAGLGEVVLRMEAERPTPVVERMLEEKLRGEFEFVGPRGPRRIGLHGVADRLDLLEDGTFRLIDYKLSSAPNKSRALQLPIYGLCAEQRLHQHRGRNWTLGEAAYISFRGPQRVTPLFTKRSDRDQVMTAAQERLIDAVDAIERGEFPPTPTDVFVCGFCSFAAVCRKDYVGDV
jgi:RecB family exonuclease